MITARVGEYTNAPLFRGQSTNGGQRSTHFEGAGGVFVFEFEEYGKACDRFKTGRGHQWRFRSDADKPAGSLSDVLNRYQRVRRVNYS